MGHWDIGTVDAQAALLPYAENATRLQSNAWPVFLTPVVACASSAQGLWGDAATLACMAEETNVNVTLWPHESQIGVSLVQDKPGPLITLARVLLRDASDNYAAKHYEPVHIW